MCNYEDHDDCNITLQNKELWQQFHKHETEMIITKSGRRMFPPLRIQIQGLDPAAHYCVLLEMVPVSNCRYKYTASGGWTPAGTEEAQSRYRLYVHQQSPCTGEQWMGQHVSFSKMKLTNNTSTATNGQIVLNSMHKYQPRIIIAKTMNPEMYMCAPCRTAIFEETSFIAVTAYQNKKVTQLKIYNNPFAKGFRINGQSKASKRKISETEEESETPTTPDKEISLSLDVSTPSIKSEDSTSLLLTPSPNTTSPQNVLPTLMPACGCGCNTSPATYYDFRSSTPYHVTNPYGMPWVLPYWYQNYPQYYNYYSIPPSPYQQNYFQPMIPRSDTERKSRRVTDFSIKSIVGTS